jgi:hypothetical protein
MLSFVVGVVIGGALLGLIWMLATRPAMAAYRSGNGSSTVTHDTRDAWILAYVLGALTYALLRISGIIAY